MREKLRSERKMEIIGMIMGVGDGVEGEEGGRGKEDGEGEGIEIGRNEMEMRRMINYKRKEEMKEESIEVNYINEKGK